MGWTFEQVDVPVPHTDITVWASRCQGNDIGLFHFDPFARPGKRSGAWISTYRSQYWGNDRVPPIVLNTCNFLKPGDGVPALLSYTNAITCSRSSATPCTAWRAECATTPSPAPAWYATSSSSSSSTSAGSPPPSCSRGSVGTSRPTSPSPPSCSPRSRLRPTPPAGSVRWNSCQRRGRQQFHLQTEAVDPSAFEDATLTEWLPSAVVMRHRTPTSHIFSGDGYSAGYYCYLWADTLVADAAEASQEQGYYNQALFQRYPT